MEETYGNVTWSAHCSVIVGGQCVGGTVNEGCEPLGGEQCMNHFRG
jgi:hypothetical protein